MFLGSMAFGQDWDLGVKGGLNVSWGKVDNLPVDISSTVGVHLGGYATTPVTDQVSLQPELLFSIYGWKSETLDVKRTLTYLSIPVAVKYYLVENFNVHAGPQLSFLVQASDDFDEQLKSTDFGVLFGAEYFINQSLGLGFRYNMGISDVLDVGETDVKIYSRVLHFSVLYKLSK